MESVYVYNGMTAREIDEQLVEDVIERWPLDVALPTLPAEIELRQSRA